MGMESGCSECKYESTVCGCLVMERGMCGCIEDASVLVLVEEEEEEEEKKEEKRKGGSAEKSGGDGAGNSHVSFCLSTCGWMPGRVDESR